MPRRRDEDRGAALIMVVLIGFISVVLVTTGLTVATSGLRQAATSQQSTSALDAAYAGVADYLARINADDGYVKYGNPSAPFSSGSSVTMDSTNAAFGLGATVLYGSGANWASVPGSAATSGGVPKAFYRYQVDTSAYKTTGTVRLQVTGLAADRTRSLLVPLRVRGFFDYSYFTNYEISDPSISGAPQSCVQYAYAGRPANCGGVQDLTFGRSDAISGDVHSNDEMIICGASINGKITTSYNVYPYYTYMPCDASDRVWRTDITHADPLLMPATNQAMQTNAGCLYTGPTQVTYKSDGTMNVVSPWSQSISNPATCGDPSALDTPAGATVPQLDHDLLYVQAVPSSTTTMPANLQCIDASGTPSSTATDGPGWAVSTTTSGKSGKGGGTTTIGTTTTVRYPLDGESPATVTFADPPSQWPATNPYYGCRSGDLYVKGTVTTQTTAASANYVYVIGDTTYADASQDVLGLVGQNAVMVWNPMQRTTDSKGNPVDTPMLSDSGREIDAAIASVAHTFLVQNFARGSSMRGALTVFGSIAQQFRGPVAATYPDTGYTKAYRYDSLLKTVGPPKFLAPSAITFTVTRYASIPAAYSSTGAAR